LITSTSIKNIRRSLSRITLKIKMAATHMQATGASLTDRSKEDKALRKAERKRRKKEKRKQEKIRKAEEAAGLVEQSTSHEAERPTPPSIKHDDPIAADRLTPRINTESLESARAYYSPASSKSAPEHIGTPTSLAQTIVGNSGQIIKEGHTTTQSHDPLTKGPLQSARSQPSLLSVDENLATNSSLSMSIYEYENSMVMLDRPELDSPDALTCRRPSVPDYVDSDDDGSVEETITTQGAKATLSQASTALAPKPHLQALDLSVDQDDSDGEEDSNLGDSDPRGLEPEDIKHRRHAGFPAPENLPEWFPRNIKQIYLVDRHGGALTFKVSMMTQRYLLVDS